MSAYAGQTVQLGFYFESHSAYNQYGSYVSSVGPGWYVDDIQITSFTPAPGIVEFSDARYFVNEGGANATISVARKHGSAGAVDVTFWASDGTAISGEDFDAVVETVSWADGEQGVRTVAIPIAQDGASEGNETVTMQLILPGEVASPVARENATLVIVDDDGVLPVSTNIAYLRSLVGTTNYVPTNTTGLFTVEGTVTTYTNLSSTAADELFYMQDNTNGIAVLFRGGTNQFMPQAGDRLRVTASLTNLNGLLALAADEANITNVVWRLSAGNSLPTPASLDFASGTNVPAMESMEARYVIATNVLISQSGGAFFPTVLTNIPMTNQAGLRFNLTIHPNLTNAGQVKPTAPVTIVGVLTQADPTSPYTTNYSLLPTEIQGGSPGVVQFTVANFKRLESVGTVMLTASRTMASNGPVSVSFGTVNGSALAGTDYYATNGVLAWADGEGGQKSFTVQWTNDTTEEADESFTVGLSGATVGPAATATITLVNDDFVARPVSQALPQGTNTTLSVVPTAASLDFQWWKDGAPKGNATNAALSLTNVQSGDGGNYWTVITTTAGAVTSSVAQVVIAVPVAITQPPFSQTVLAGSYVSLIVGVSGTAPFNYQWQRNGVDLAGETNSSLTFASVQLSDAAVYSVLVNNPANVPALSAAATLTVFGGGFVPAGAGLGSYTVVDGLFTVNGGGEDIEGTEDRFFFVYTPLVGDGQIIANLTGLAPADPQSEGGVMLRDGNNGGARHVFLAFDAGSHTAFRRRLVENDYSVETFHPGTNGHWLRLTRMSDTFIGHCSTNGVDWNLVWWTTVTNMPASLEAGLAVTAHRNQGIATALFTNVAVSPLSPLSGAWPGAGPRLFPGGETGGQLEFQRVGGFKTLVGGAVGDRYSVRASGDIVTPLSLWTVLGTVTNTYGVVPYLDAGVWTNASRFYRLQRLEP